MLAIFFDRILFLYAVFYCSLFITDYSFISRGWAITNISAPTGIFIVLFFLRWLAGQDSFIGTPVLRFIKKLKFVSDFRLVTLAVLITFITFLVLSVARHLSLSSSAFDLGIFDQAIWNAANGNSLYSSLKGMNLLGDHFEPVLFFIAPIYKIFPSVYVLFILQSLALASAVIPLYLIAKFRLKERLLVYAFVVSYILSRGLRGVALSDFHPECFILPLLFWAYYFLITRKNVSLWISLILLLLCKEDVTFLISGIGIFTLFFLKRPKLGIALLVSGIAMWIIETKVFIASFNPSGSYSYMDRLPFGATYQDNIKAVIDNPLLIPQLFLDKEKITYCLKIFGPLGFLSFFSPAHYILFAIPLFRNLLPANINYSGWYNITSHYTASLIPFVYISAIAGVSWLKIKIKSPKSGIVLSLIILLCSLFFYSKTDASKFAKFISSIKRGRTLEKISYLKSVPAEASVAANFVLVPHLSQRKEIFIWSPAEETSRRADYLVVDLALLDYLGDKEKGAVQPYFDNIYNLGYEKAFENSAGNFLILRKAK